MSARHRVSKLLLRQGTVYSGGVAWTGVHDAWLRKQKFESAALQLTYDTAYDTMIAAVDRRGRLDKAITAMAADSPFTPVAVAASSIGRWSTCMMSRLSRVCCPRQASGE